MAVTHVFVKPAPDRVVPIHPTHAVGVGSLLLCRGRDSSKPDDRDRVYRVMWSTEIRKRLTAGDLTLCDRAGADVPEIDAANAPEDIELDVDGALARPAVAGPAVAAFDAKNVDALVKAVEHGDLKLDEAKTALAPTEGK